MGCFIQADDNNIIDDIDIAIGNNDKSRIVELINKFFKDKKKSLINVETLMITLKTCL